MSKSRQTLRRPKEWQKIIGCTVLDPDGWRSWGPYGAKDWNEPIDHDEFVRRAAASTVHQPLKMKRNYGVIETGGKQPPNPPPPPTVSSKAPGPPPGSGMGRNERSSMEDDLLELFKMLKCACRVIDVLLTVPEIDAALDQGGTPTHRLTQEARDRLDDYASMRIAIGI